MKRGMTLLLLTVIVLASGVALAPRGTPGAHATGLARADATPLAGLEVGFGEVDITPKLGDKPVYIAGFGQNRKATRAHDPLFARAVVLKDGKKKVALVSVDLVGFFRPNVLNVRKRLPGFEYVLVSSTHTHEGPDTLGLWGPGPLRSGVDPDYLKKVEADIVTAVTKADASLAKVSARIGTARAPELLHDSREPEVKHDELVVLSFRGEKEKPAGIIVQWNCHPETLDPKSTELSADYVGVTVNRLKAKYGCPVVYFTGTVGGLMTTMRVEVKDGEGKRLPEGSWEKTERYGVLLAELAEKALKDARGLSLTPLEVRTSEVFLPMDNKLYLVARQLGVLDREAYLWAGDPYKAEPAPAKESAKRLCMKTEVGHLKFGELDVAAVPGEIYPELVLGKVQDPADPGADFPDAPKEPALYGGLKGRHRVLIGLANDEIGYIIPKRQWDEKAPFCYGRKKAQYGEQNSVGPETAPLLCKAFADLTRK
jgi:hypothetical protein